MRMTNLLHFTENHQFTVYRNFALSSLDYKMLYHVYQPMVGASAVSLYCTMYQQLPADRMGYSALEQQRKLFLALEIEPGEKGRKWFIEQTSRLEAVGLLQTSRKFIPKYEEYVYEYELQAPLSPDEFFKNQHLLLFLRDKIGKHAVVHLGRELIAPEPQELAGAQGETLSVPFYELFRLNTQVVDYELEQAFYELAPSKEDATAAAAPGDYQYAEIIARFPRVSQNRAYVEGLRYRPDELARINFVARKYELKLHEVCRLLDEDDLFAEDGSVRLDVLQRRANLLYTQERKREEERLRYLSRVAQMRGEEKEEQEVHNEKPVEMSYYLDVPPLFQNQCDIHQYNMMLRNEPYTLVLKRFFPSGRVPDGVLGIFEKINLSYKLKEEVINVLIHFIHVERRSWSKSSIEYVASDMLGKQVTTYEQAVEYVREQQRWKEKKAAMPVKRNEASSDTGTAVRGRVAAKKPNIPIISDIPEDTPLTEEEFAEMRRKAQKLDGKIR